MENFYRNSFHIEPAKGLLNDPNGLIQFKGTYYFFHQWNRYSSTHDYKEWGLFTSDDMIKWKSEGSALLPDSFEDKDGVYSGSAVEHDGQMYLFYTGNTKDQGKRKSYQKIAVSVDGKTFIKQDETIETPEGFSEHHRDPKIWRQNDEWWMILGAQTLDNQGAVTLFLSIDLINWSYKGIFYEGTELDQMCECPDFFSVTENIDILAVCPQRRTPFQKDDLDISSYSGYLVGKLNENSKKFDSVESIKKFDEGFDFYAPQTFEDDKGRRIIVAWMSRMDTKEEQECPTVEQGYLHCLTMPRELIWKNDRLYQQPLEEYTKLRRSVQTFTSNARRIQNTSNAYEIIIDFNEEVNEFALSLNMGENEILLEEGLLKVSRVNWVTNKVESKELFVEHLFKLQVFCDTSTVEIFVNEGESVFSMRTFVQQENRSIEITKMNKQCNIQLYTY